MAIIGIHAANPLILLPQDKVTASIVATVSAFFNVDDSLWSPAAIVSSPSAH
ncbi:hypothetical protein H6G41_09575 [Tolypothrix sp. FACHB-123]|uniref:hypothetical protein n=1 Tax=Tolypothrix sp. FACHB-123 TaxID=2692868 RepID=UPI001689D7EF|nr:hypothetical protein [Tolypothrix sp. FACHB-123]MBD2354868.1 hypothetical protein [Tolypothrix sp. FACHB-123]